MANCKEFVFDDIMAVTAIPVTAFNPGVAAWQLTPTIPSSSFSPPLSSSITIGYYPMGAGRPLIPIMSRTAKAKDDENDSIAGRLHTVTITCDADARNVSIWSSLLTIERTPSHLMLTFRDKTRAFVSSTKDTYKCTTEREGSKTIVTFRIENTMGIQMIV